MRVPKRQSEILAQSKQQDDHYLTPEAMERMRREITRLEKEERPVVIEEMQEAATQGDFSENAGYQAAKQHLRRINGKIDRLNDALRFAIPIAHGANGTVRIGTTVTVRANDREVTYEILGSQESNPGRGRISHLSPIGAALLGHKVGDTVDVGVNGSSVAYTILHLA